MWYCSETDEYVKNDCEADILCSHCIHNIYGGRCCKWVLIEEDSENNDVPF